MEPQQGSPYPLLGIMIAFIIMLIPSYKIARKAGFGWGMAILLSIPGISFLTYWVFAFIKWPIERLTNPLSKK